MPWGEQDYDQSKLIAGSKHPCTLADLTTLYQAALRDGFPIQHCRPGVPRDWRPSWHDHGIAPAKPERRQADQRPDNGREIREAEAAVEAQRLRAAQQRHREASHRYWQRKRRAAREQAIAAAAGA